MSERRLFHFLTLIILQNKLQFIIISTRLLLLFDPVFIFVFLSISSFVSVPVVVLLFRLVVNQGAAFSGRFRQRRLLLGL